MRFVETHAAGVRDDADIELSVEEPGLRLSCEGADGNNGEDGPEEDGPEKEKAHPRRL